MKIGFLALSGGRAYWLGEQLYGDEATRRRCKGFFAQLKPERIAT